MKGQKTESLGRKHTMEAIVEMIGALIGALIQSLFGLIEAVAALIGIALEFAFLALTRGVGAASRQYKLRRQERAERLVEVKQAADAPPRNETSSISPKQSAILGSFLFFAIICSVVTWIVIEQIRKQRVAQTRSQVDKLADAFAEQLKDDGVADPEPGKLRDRDAWQQPLELFVDKTLLGSLVVVRSSGADHKSGSIDDILAARVIQADAKEVGGELVKRGIKAIRVEAFSDFLSPKFLSDRQSDKK